MLKLFFNSFNSLYKCSYEAISPSVQCSCSYPELIDNVTGTKQSAIGQCGDTFVVVSCNILWYWQYKCTISVHSFLFYIQESNTPLSEPKHQRLAKLLLLECIQNKRYKTQRNYLYLTMKALLVRFDNKEKLQ